MYYLFIVLWFVFLAAINSDVLTFDKLKDLQEKTLSSLRNKASEPLINSTCSSFLALFTIYAMYEIMNYRLFTFPYLYPRCWFAYG
jgi:hypothetical protein